MTAVIIQNLAVAAVIAAAVWLARLASRREDWRIAWRELKSKRLAVASMAVMGIYVAVGMLDSVVWRDAVRDDSGKHLADSAGAPLYTARARSLLDRICAGLVNRQEKTYSAPFAARQYTMETVDTGDGAIQRIKPELRHPRTHPLGTDRVGTDILYQALKGVRTALIIGGLSTLLIIPLAIIFGVSAGYFGGRVDDAVFDEVAILVLLGVVSKRALSLLDFSQHHGAFGAGVFGNGL